MPMTVLERDVANSTLRANAEIVKKLNGIDMDECRYNTANTIFPVLLKDALASIEFMTTFDGAVKDAAQKAVECSDALLKALREKGWQTQK